MGIHVIKMPDIGEGIAEVELVKWHVKAGDTVVEDQVLADVMTDKATVEIPSPVHGTVLSTTGKVGERRAVGTELIRIEVEGAGNLGAVPEAHAAASQAAPPAVAKATVTAAPKAPLVARQEVAAQAPVPLPAKAIAPVAAT